MLKKKYSIIITCNISQVYLQKKCYICLIYITNTLFVNRFITSKYYIYKKLAVLTTF